MEKERMPRVRFEGNEQARMMGTVFAENLVDLCRKVEDGSDAAGTFEKGFLHTSTLPHEGTCYYDQMWSRDAGRGIQELARFGFVEKASCVVDYVLAHKNYGDHWGRLIDRRMEEDYELDGNTHLLCGIYLTWHGLGRKRDVGIRYVEDTREVFAWMERLMDECPYGQLIPCVSELAGNPQDVVPVYAIYPNYGARVCFLAFAEMADACGMADVAGQYRRRAGELEEAMKGCLISGGVGRGTQTPEGIWLNGLRGDDGTVYEIANFGARYSVHHWTRQVPYIQAYDMGVDSLPLDSMESVNRRSYGYLRHEMARGYYFRRYGFVSNTCWTGSGGRHDDTMCGYGQNYFSQAALMADDVNTYGKCLEGIVRLAYDGDIIEPMTFEMNPWVLHECFAYDNYEKALDHTFGRVADWENGVMDNPGDEGNLVQACETLKTLALTVGLSAREGCLIVKPRLPWRWDGMEVRDYPVVDEEGKVHRISLSFRHERWLRRCSLKVTQADGLTRIRVRFGPFPEYPGREEELSKSYRLEKTRGASWLWQESVLKEELAAEL